MVARGVSEDDATHAHEVSSPLSFDELVGSAPSYRLRAWRAREESSLVLCGYKVDSRCVSEAGVCDLMIKASIV